MLVFGVSEPAMKMNEWSVCVMIVIMMMIMEVGRGLRGNRGIGPVQLWGN